LIVCALLQGAIAAHDPKKKTPDPIRGWDVLVRLPAKVSPNAVVQSLSLPEPFLL
jgi:hypothetical protein